MREYQNDDRWFLQELVRATYTRCSGLRAMLRRLDRIFGAGSFGAAIDFANPKSIS
jgi:hypothetical protein